jgi:hypothetical protein
VWLQYRRRKPAIPRVLFAAAVLAAIPAARLSGNYAWAVQTRVSSRHVGPAEFQIALDPRKQTMWQELSGLDRYGDPNFVHLEIPIRIDGLAEGDQVLVNRLQMDYVLPVRVGQFGFGPNAMFHDFKGDRGWLKFYVHAARYGHVPQTPIDIKGSADLTLFVRTQIADDSSNRVSVPGVGVCGPYPRGCITALPRAAVEVDHNNRVVSYIITPFDTYAPIPTPYLLNPVTEKLTSPGLLVVRRPVAWFHRTFEFRNIKLSDYVR